jgi:superfamily I DNA and/or RNA helicase
MISEFRVYLRDFISNDNPYNWNDILCKTDHTNTFMYGETIENQNAFNEMLRKSNLIEKETGVNPLCQSKGLLYLKNPKKESISAPILLKEIKVKIENEHYKIEEFGDFFLNPFLIKFLKIRFWEEVKSLDEFKKLYTFKNLEINESISLIGNFHPYRFEIFRDLSEIAQTNKTSPILSRLLMLENNESESYFEWKLKPILQLDHHQKKALEILKYNSVLVHGPPGTGKSQLIGNVIGSAINSNLSILMSSEKKASIDAVYKRLEKVRLHRFCLVNYSKNENKLLIRDLKKTWDFLTKELDLNHFQIENNYPFSQIINQFISKSKNGKIKLKNLIPGLKNSDSLVISEFNHFNDFKENEHHIDLINEGLFKLTNKLNFNQQWNEQQVDYKINECEKTLDLVSPYCAVESINDLDKLVRNLLIIEGFSNSIYQKYGELICKNPRKIKRLFSDSFKIEKNNLIWNGILNHWIKIPSKKEIEFIKEHASKKGLINRIKFHRIWKKWVRTSELDPISTCDDMLNNLIFQEEKMRFSLELTELGIESVHDLKLIREVIKKHSSNDWNWYQNLNGELKQNFKQVHSHVSSLKMLLKKDFNFTKDDKIIVFCNQIKAKRFSILKELSLIQKLPNSIKDLLQKCSDLNNFYNQIYLSLWKSQFGNIEIPTSLTQKEWIKAAIRFQKNNAEISKFNSSELIEAIKNKFDSYHKLIDTPNRKLKTEEQKLKAELKIGKSILIKEFGKVKQHLNFRKLYESEAKKWLFVIKPILMMHPLRIATYFPAEPGLFDLGIIDEASQMPLKNAIGTMQRVKRILIAGDENQMDPSYFFSSNENEHSVFHQAKYQLKNIELTNHYRSESEELIAFSNRYFYENKLRFIEQASSVQKQSITHHFVKNGNYHDGVNEYEARKVADFVLNELDKIGNEMSLGIVAFSETQLKAIIQKIPIKYTTIIEELEGSNRLFFKTLDQVQGDECDNLIISFGYGKNKEGNFEMRFGPINQTGGEKRLNVLFSRAKKEIHFFSSVKYIDFPQSKNVSVQLLKQWFAMLEDTKLEKINSYEINMFDILEQAKDFEDFTHLISLYNQRGWKILTT